LGSYNAEIDHVLLMSVDEEELIQRLIKRAGDQGRSDDNESTIRERMRVYREQTQPLIDFYRQRGQLTTVSGEGSIDEVQQRISKVLV
jgi:adenylate kinase